jgi:hypothetical protein
MSQRVYLMGVAPETLELFQRYITSERDREPIGVALAQRAEAHQRAVAVSERVIASLRSKARDADENGAFLAAANLQPYFITAPDADGVLSAMDWLERPRTEPELEEFFAAQGAALGMRCGKLSRTRFPAPDLDTLTRAVVHYLGTVVAHRESASVVAASLRPPTLWRRAFGPRLDTSGPVPREEREARLAQYGLDAWRALGMLIARLGPAWWQGRGQWLGFVAHRDHFNAVRTTVTEIRPGTPQWTTETESPPPALPSSDAANELRRLLTSTSALLPELALSGWDQQLHPAGEAYGTCAFIAPDGLGTLSTLLEGEPWAELEPYAIACFGQADGIASWRLVVTASARYAAKRRLYLLEGDEVFERACRWPPL